MVGRRVITWALPLALMAMVGCKSSSVGDPCTPEEIPEGGFNSAEAYLETSSVQCRTRVCLVYKLGGDPSQVIEEGTCEEEGVCVNADELEQQVTCSCRCDAPEGQPTCDCPGGFVCTEILDLGGQGVRGSYCVSEEARCRLGDFDDDPDGFTMDDC